MSPIDHAAIADEFYCHGFVSPINIINKEEAAHHRSKLESIEDEHGPMHYKPKIHTLLASPLELATHPKVLDVVEAILGPDILLYDATYIIKEPGAPAHISWHQDLTYWGLENDQQVSMWLALSLANEESGCMRMLPGSHRSGRQPHRVMEDETNVLLQGQTVIDVAADAALLCPLQPGQASFHHGWTLHCSLPNNSADRRIGLNVQFVTPSNRQTKHELGSGLVVRGEDRFGYYQKDIPAACDMEPNAIIRHAELNRLYLATAGQQ